MKIVGIIPSRLKSTRLPDKPLVNIIDLPLILHVYKRACLSPILDEVIVATDSEEILERVIRAGGKAILTSINHKNGTERIAEVAEKIDTDLVVLINGDEALLNPDYIEKSVKGLLDRIDDKNVVASILCNKYLKENSPSDFKLALNLKSEVMYISRADIPCNARNPREFMYKAYHIMAFRKDFLFQYRDWEKTPIELVEDHEHLRVLEHGYKIIAVEVESSAVSVDTPEDLQFVIEKMKVDPFYKKYASV